MSMDMKLLMFFDNRALYVFVKLKYNAQYILLKLNCYNANYAVCLERVISPIWSCYSNLYKTTPPSVEIVKPTCHYPIQMAVGTRSNSEKNFAFTIYN